MTDEQKQFPGCGQPCTTTAPVTPGNFSDTAKEFGRTKDVERVFSVSRTNNALCAARFLLKPGRKYEEAVKTFQPYDKVKEPNLEARAAGAALIKEGKKTPGRKTFVFVNNRLEGSALETIAAMLEMPE